MDTAAGSHTLAADRRRPAMAARRESITLSSLDPPGIVGPASAAHETAVGSLFAPATASLLEHTVRLKATLRTLAGGAPAAFWRALMRGLTEAAGAQYAFAVQRVVDGDDDVDWGERGSCALGVAFYCAEVGGEKGFHADYEYEVFGGPCQWMKENRVLLIAEGLERLVPHMAKKGDRVPVMPDAYLAVPLWGEDGKCFGHLGMCWTKDGGKKRPHGWGELEMFLHAFEDVVAERMVRQGLEKRRAMEEEEEAKTPAKDRRSVPPELLPGSFMGDKRPSLRPYARRLSHELRTPMQGVVGMLDVMYATVMEATEANSKGREMKNIQEVIDGLKANIEVAQDSSKRAVDAADNMVQAYDFNMEIPATPSRGSFDETGLHVEDDDYSFPVPDNEPTRPSKRRRDSTGSPTSYPRNKIPHLEPLASPARSGTASEEPAPVQTPRRGSRGITPTFRLDNYNPEATPTSEGYFANRGGTPALSDSGSMFTLAAEPVQLRSLLHEAVHYSLRTGGRPEAAIVTRTPCGECVTVKNTTDDSSTVHIEIKVEPDVPDNLILDGAALTKIISAVFHNAFKFTPEGSITLHTQLSPASHLLFTIKDTGTGIPADFVPEMFKPFSREDDSLTSDRDGLGLGLMVAKSIARKMFGELWCEHTSTQAPSGTEFRVQIPLHPPITAPTTPAPPAATSPDRPAAPPPPTAAPKPPRQLDYDPALATKLPLRILVVEDNRINRQLLCSMLRKLGYSDVSEARDGEEAVRTFINTPRPFDLILMDLWMPKLDGFDAAEQIGRVHRERSEEDGRGRLRIVAVSADATEEARSRARGVGIDGFVGKPFTLRELGRAVTRWGSVC